MVLKYHSVIIHERYYSTGFQLVDELLIPDGVKQRLQEISWGGEFLS